MRIGRTRDSKKARRSGLSPKTRGALKPKNTIPPHVTNCPSPRVIRVRGSPDARRYVRGITAPLFVRVPPRCSVLRHPPRIDCPIKKVLTRVKHDRDQPRDNFLSRLRSSSEPFK